tara:strand:+ start:628 stop:2724 length:2097 start_codon:yes stop_codon:yes gene_type:complete
MIIKNNLLLLISFVIGSILTIFFIGYDHIGFTNTKWITNYDGISDFLALKFFLQDKWQFPIGLNSNYGELENSIVFSGAVPILSIITKVFKNILPYNFHYFNIWIMICFSLHIFFSYKLIFSLTKDINFSAVSSLFFLFSPVLIQRLDMHLSLGAHWLLLAYFYLEIEPSIKFKNFYRTFLVIFSSLVHFYFTIMILLINLIFKTVIYLKNRNLKLFFIENFIIIFFLLLSMYIVGYFSIPVTDSLGFGYGFYKANLLTFFDQSSNGDFNSWSLFLPDINNTSGEQEGFGYLGLGLIGTICILIYYVSINFLKLVKNNIQYVSIFVIFMLIAFTTTINIGEVKILDLKLANFVYAPLSIIRASGRFIWPAYYLLIIFSLFAFYKLKFKTRYLLIIFLIQIIDLAPGIDNFFGSKIEKLNTKLNDPIWSNLDVNFKSIKTTKISNSSNIFIKVSDLMINKDFLETNIARLGRFNRTEASILRAKLYKNLIDKNINLETIYIIDNPDHLRHVKFLYQDSNHGIFFRDELWLLLPNSKKNIKKIDSNELSNVKYLEVELNKKYKLQPNLNVGMLGFGWSHASYGRTLNNEGVWSEGFQSSLLFNIKKDIKINTINFNIKKIINFHNKPLIFDIFINNNFFKTVNLKETSNLSLSLKTDNFDFKDSINLIDFKIKNPVTPISILESVDGRLLGFLIKDIEFK